MIDLSQKNTCLTVSTTLRQSLDILAVEIRESSLSTNEKMLLRSAMTNLSTAITRLTALGTPGGIR